MADTVILNATRSEAATLLEPPPPRLGVPGGLADSAEGYLSTSKAFAVEEEYEGSPLGVRGEAADWPVADAAGDRTGASRAPPRLWAPPSRNGAGAASPDGLGDTRAGGASAAPAGGYASTDSARWEAPSRFSDLAPAAPPALGADGEPQATTVVQGRVRSQAEAVSEVHEAAAGGEAGLGRTTFVRNLFCSYARDASFPVNDASAPNAKRLFGENPEALCTEIVLQDPESKVYWHYLVQDTPGYGDSTDLATDRSAILDYIRACSEAYLEQARSRAAGLPTIDLQFITELAQEVPVVPVLAKADTMTAEELKARAGASNREFRHRVRAALHKAGVHSPFSRDALEDAGSRHGAGPFAVICSNTMDLDVGRFWPVRKYPWGSVEAMLAQHSDLPVLRRLLFESGYVELKEATEARFHEFRCATAARSQDFRHVHCGGRRGLGSALAGAIRLAALAGGLALAGWLLVSGAPAVKDGIVRNETVRRVKDKVEDAVEAAVDTAYTAKGIAKSATTAAVDVTKQAADSVKEKAARALESDETRKAREEAAQPRAQYRRRPWWQLWGE
ncbi:septin-7-like isoform X11 [Micractinium conductrix]|uniref:Septin-7-like isoform X11 n=1 Tax=Micractinium conductrix TaxID=554055 RepID=A0A2P6VGP5_9CHLO|nr:septin-7-like isoform X11 [Micractinium conductrix]|eukprot:PSC73238.1 septin-7-like isoform X11 [Micractinium conductrix]